MIIRRTMEYMIPWWTKCFTCCIKEGSFPRIWKNARVVLLEKDGKPRGVQSSYRPICLLNEAGKVFERVPSGTLAGFAEGGYWIVPTPVWI